MKKINITILTLTGTMLCAVPASAAVLFFEGFETGTTTAGTAVTGRSPDVDNTTNDAVVWNQTGTTPSGTIQIGTGTNTTNVLRYTVGGGNTSFTLGDIGDRLTLGQFSADIRWIAGTAAFGFGADIAASLNTSGETGNRIRGSRTLAQSGLAANEWGTMTLVFNGTGSTISYANGAHSLATGTGDLWINNTLQQTVAAMGTAGGGFDYFGLRGFGESDLIVEFDNFELRDNILIPEPSTFLLSGFGLLALVIRRRRA